MLLDFFKKKHHITFADSDGLYKATLTNEELEKLSIQENEYNNLIINELISEFSKNISQIEKKDLSEYNQKILKLITEEVQYLKNNSLTEYEFFDKYRSIFKSFISLIINQSWQSPDYGYNIYPQHGINQKKIYSFYNDYQRYRADTLTFEEKVLKESNDISNTNKKAYLFNSGMSAFLCLINSFKDFDSKIKIGSKNLYFEIDSFLKYQNNIEFFDNQINDIIGFIKSNKPSFLFFDLLPNSPNLQEFNLKELFDFYISDPPNNETNIIIDTTLNFTNFNLSTYFKDLPEKLNVFLYRSLQKLDQYGLDIVSGGILIHYGHSRLNIDGIRQMGFTPTEEQVLTLSLLPRNYLNYRYKIICRNSLIIAYHLKNLKSEILEIVSYPMLATNLKSKNYQLTTELSFHRTESPLLYFKLNDSFNLEEHNIFIKEFLHQTKLNNLPIVLGTSFGFNITRIMIINDQEGKICIRLSAGTEKLKQVLDICSILEKIILSFMETLLAYYKENKAEFFKAKMDMFSDYIKQLENKNESNNTLDKLLYLFSDIMSNVKKFKNNKGKAFYKHTLDSLAEKTLSVASRSDISDEQKKEVIKMINSFYN